MTIQKIVLEIANPDQLFGDSRDHQEQAMLLAALLSKTARRIENLGAIAPIILYDVLGKPVGKLEVTRA